MSRLLAPIAIVLLVIAGVVGILIVPHAGTQAAPQLSGTSLDRKPVPDVRLRDQWGKMVSLRSLRGRPTLLTFMESQCKESCPVIAEEVRRTAQMLDESGEHVNVVAITTSPEEDTVASVRRFSREHGMLDRWHYLIGTRAALIPVWHDFAVYAAPANAPAKLRDMHTTATFVIDAQGRERELITGDLDATTLGRDLRIVGGRSVEPLGRDAAAAPEVGHPAPNFTLHTDTGTIFSLRSLRGHTVLLHVWTTWCQYCRQEMGTLAGWQRHHASRGLQVVGVNWQEPLGTVRDFVRKEHIPYTIVLDTNGDVRARYHAYNLPMNVLIGPDGVIRSIRLGAVDTAFFTHQVAPLLEKEPAA